MHKRTIVSKFNWLIILSVVLSVAVTATSITAYLVHRFSLDATAKDRLHIKGLTSSVKGFIDNAFSLNHMLSINSTIVNAVTDAHQDWPTRTAQYAKSFDTRKGLGAGSGMPLLVKLQQEYDFTELFFVQDAAGNQTMRSYGPLGQRGNRWWFKQFMADPQHRPFVSKTYYSMTGDKPVASAFHPIYRNNRLIGVMGTDINFDKLQTMVENYLQSKDLYAVVVDNQGVIIAHPDRQRLREIYNLKDLTKRELVKDAVGRTVVDAQGYHRTRKIELDWSPHVSTLMQAVLGGYSGLVRHVALDRIDSTVYYEPVPLPGQNGSQGNFGVLLIRDNTTLLQTKLKICLFSLVFTIMATIMLIGLFRSRFRRSIRAPLQMLTRSMQQAEAVNHEDITLKTDDEFQTLATAYNDMRRKLATAHDEMRRLNEDLEKRVASRTKALEQANRKLKQDIVARRIIEDALRESEEKYRFLIENANDAIFVAQDGKVKFANTKTRELAKRLGADITKDRYLDFVHPDEREAVMERQRKRAEGQPSSPSYSFRLVSKSREEIWVSVSAVLIDWDGQPATLNFLEDITRQMKLEAQVQQSQRLKAIGTLAGGIAHDFNNLLMGIQGNVSLMLLEVAPEDQHYEHLCSIERCVMGAADLTKQLLGYARGGKYMVRPTHINELVHNTARMFSRTRKELTIHESYARRLRVVKADQKQLEQVLLNIYINAWQAMPNGGHLYLKTDMVAADAPPIDQLDLKPGPYVRITITDTGVGMDEATRQRVFEPFFTTKKMGRGTGLGLASSFGIIRNHGGIIDVQSSKGRGATFFIYLPASEEISITPRPNMQNNMQAGSETVLVVDDEDKILRVAPPMLESLGYRVLVARGGRAAVAMFEEKGAEIDIVILDMVMPDLSGAEVFDYLKTNHPTIRVLLSSGYSAEGQAARILAKGCDGFIQKPFNLEQLSKALRQILDD